MNISVSFKVKGVGGREQRLKEEEMVCVTTYVFAGVRQGTNVPFFFLPEFYGNISHLFIEIIFVDLRFSSLLFFRFPHHHHKKSYYCYLLKSPISNIHPFQKGRKKKSIALIDWRLFSRLPPPLPPPPPQASSCVYL